MCRLTHTHRLIAGAVVTTSSAAVICGADISTSETSAATQLARRRIAAKPTVLKIDPFMFSADTKPDVDLRNDIKTLGIGVRPRQAPRGTCSVFAMTFILEYMYAENHGFKNPDSSEEYLNYASNLAIGQKVDGGFFDEIDKGYQKFGIVDEGLAPYKSAFDPNAVIRPEILAKGFRHRSPPQASFHKALER